ncbi:ermin [Indicator indicator]|uniref:ermin n=1 Tax=Indicator indicator TaxID=1002788 RepID=UPI0023DFFC36|nr:ermin [Indicator indicator]
MTEEAPVASTMPECNGSLAPEKGPLRGVEVIDERAKPAGTGPYLTTDTSLNTPPAGENQQENRNSLAQGIVHELLDGEKQCEEKQEDNSEMLQQGAAGTQDMELAGQEPEEGLGSEETSVSSGELGLAATPDREVVETPTASTDGRGNTTEEEAEEEEEDTEEDEVQVIDIKKENSEVSHLNLAGSGKEASPPSTPGCNPSQVEKGTEQPSLGKRNDISRHSYSRYNTISYRRIRKGNTKQRIDEFESMMHL